MDGIELKGVVCKLINVNKIVHFSKNVGGRHKF